MEIESPMIRTLGNFGSSIGLSKGLEKGSFAPQRTEQALRKKRGRV
jgi:hypothetical protein